MTAAPTSPPTPMTTGPTSVPPHWWSRRPTAVAVNRFALFALIANIAIVATGGLVRLTGSGLGCPAWPNCAGDSVVPTSELSWHKYVEFGNRLFTYVVLIATITVLVAVLRERPRRPQLRVWAWLVFLAVPAQAVMGGVTVLTHLNPWAVAAHFVLSMLLVGATTVLWWRTRVGSAPSSSLAIHPHLRKLGWLMWLLTYAVFAAGTVVTGAGPHAGDPTADRIAIKPGSVAQLHADLVMLLVGASIVFAVAVTVVGGPIITRTTTRWLLAALALQAAIGYAQYFDKLPIGLVELHMIGAACIAVAATAVVLSLPPSTRQRPISQSPRQPTV